MKTDQLPQIKQALLDGDTHAAHFATHSIKGASATIGFDSLSAAAKALDDLVQLLLFPHSMLLCATPSFAFLYPAEEVCTVPTQPYTPARAESFLAFHRFEGGRRRGRSLSWKIWKKRLTVVWYTCPSPPLSPFLSSPILPRPPPAHLTASCIDVPPLAAKGVCASMRCRTGRLPRNGCRGFRSRVFLGTSTGTGCSRSSAISHPCLNQPCTREARAHAQHLRPGAPVPRDTVRVLEH